MKRLTRKIDSLKNSVATDSVNISEKWFTHVPRRDQNHLLNSLRNLDKGRAPTPSFPLYGSTGWDVVERFLNSQEVRSTHPPKWLLEYEFSRKDKFGPQGGYAPWDDLRDDAMLYFSRPVESSIEPKPSILRKYERLSLLMMSPTDTLKVMKLHDKVQERANGWRLFSLKKTDPAAQRDALYLIHSGEWTDGWAYFFSRFNKQKKRLFMPMPFSANIQQNRWAIHFLQAIQADLRLNGSGSDFSFWGDKIGFLPLFKTIINDHTRDVPIEEMVFIMRDFEKMDTSVGVSQKRQSFVPKLAASYHYSRNSAPYRELENSMLFSNRCPIATPDGMWTGDHGEASGSSVTNMGETCCNEDYDTTFQQYLYEEASKKGISYTVLGSYGNGDDGLTIVHLPDVKRFPEFDELVRACAQLAAVDGGYRIQADKWDVNLGTYGKYCQYLTSRIKPDADMVMYYPAALILNAIMNPEKQYAPADWDKDYRDLDIISKLNNGFDLPYFHALVDYVDNGMKYGLLRRSETETYRILSKWDRYRALRDGSYEYNVINSDWDDDITSSPTVRYLLEKRDISRNNHNRTV